MNIRRLTAADLAELDAPVCAASDCPHEANWEVGSGGVKLPNEAATTFQTVRFYCDLHARTFCLETNVKLPPALRLN